MIDRLVEKLNNNNYQIIDDLSSVILDNKITNLDDLKEIQEKNFVINGISMNDDQKVKYCIVILRNDIYDFDNLNFDEIQLYKRLMNEIDNTDNINTKIKNLIILFSLTRKEMLFPYYAYQFIIDDKLK